MKPRRTERLAEQIRMELGRLISTEMRDPRVGFATVTGVKLTPDLRQAHVMVSVVGTPEMEEQSVLRIQAAAPFLRRGLARALSLRYTPDLSFELDRAWQKAERVEELLRRAQKRAGVPRGGTGAGE